MSDPYNSTATPPVRMRTDDPLVGQIRAALPLLMKFDAVVDVMDKP